MASLSSVVYSHDDTNVLYLWQVLLVFHVPLLVEGWDSFGLIMSTVVELNCGLLTVLLMPLGVITASIQKMLVSDVVVEVLVIRFMYFIY